MYSQKLFVFTILLLASFPGKAQTDRETSKSATVGTDNLKKETKELYQRKGKLAIFWGYNRAAYGHSNMRFKGAIIILSL